jgi:arylsulfatase A-like enzyme
MAQRPHVIVLMADTVRHDLLGCYGGVARTPHLDALARRSHRFERLYQPATMCQPSRVTWMTGCLPATTQVYLNGFGNNRRLRPTLLRTLADAGYRGGYLGLFHCWQEPDRDGIDAWSMIDWMYDWMPEHGSWQIDDAQWKRWLAHVDSLGITPVETQLKDFHHHAGWTDFPRERHPAVRLADRALECIDDVRAGQPHLLWTSFWMPHEPWAPPRELLDLYRLEDMPLPASWRDDLATRPEHQRALNNAAQFAQLGPDTEANLRRLWAAYAACMTLVDEQCGRIIAALERKGIYDDSLVIFMTDHGTTHGAHGWLYKGSSFMIDEVSRVPCLVKLPGQREARVIDDVVSSADLYPTVCEALGIAHGPVDGRSWSDVFAGGRRDARAFGQHGDGSDTEAKSVRSLRRGRWKYNLYSAPGVDELYDLDADPHELRNIVRDCPSERSQLRAELVDAIRSSSDRFEVR